jgi:hypothetical protein
MSNAMLLLASLENLTEQEDSDLDPDSEFFPHRKTASNHQDTEHCLFFSLTRYLPASVTSIAMHFPESPPSRHPDVGLLGPPSGRE